MAVEFVRVHIAGKPADQTFVLARRDFNPAVHTLADAPTPAPTPTDPLPNIADLNAVDAKALIEAADVTRLPDLKAAETVNPKYAGGRKSVLDAIEARIAG